MSKPLLVIGSGGHASVLVDVLLQQNRIIVGIVSPTKPDKNSPLDGFPYYSCDESILTFTQESVKLVNGIGSLPENSTRSQIYEQYEALGYEFEKIVAPSAIVSSYTTIGKGAQILPGAIIQTGVVLGKNSIVNSGAIIEHDCVIGAHNHIAPGVTLSGNVKTSELVHIGTGSSVIQSITIKKNVVIGAGSIITKNIHENVIHYPARGYIKEKKYES